MKTYWIPLLVTPLLCVSLVFAQQHPTTVPTTAPSEGRVIYTLEDSQNKTIQNPTADDIKTAMALLDAEKIDYLILRTNKTFFLQADRDSANAFIFECEVGDEQHMYKTPKPYSRDIAVKLFQSFMSGKEDWMKMVEWEPWK